LARNGVPANKLVVSRHGLAQSAAPADRDERASRPATGSPLRIVFLGRLHPTKGLDILLNAVARLPQAPLRLDIFGVLENGLESAYMRWLHALAADDPRIRFCAPIASERIVDVLRSYDVVAVPSRWLETGPLVVLEAFAAGVPVVGARLGGIVELVRTDVDGLLVDPESCAAWSTALLQLIDEPYLLERLRAGVRPPRHMGAVAEEMLTTYRELLRAG